MCYWGARLRLIIADTCGDIKMADAQGNQTRKLDETDSLSETSFALSLGSIPLNLRPTQREREDLTSQTDESALNELPSDGEFFKPVSQRITFHGPKFKEQKYLIFCMMANSKETFGSSVIIHASPSKLMFYLNHIVGDVSSSKLIKTDTEIDGAIVNIVTKNAADVYLFFKYNSKYHCLEIESHVTSAANLGKELSRIVGDCIQESDIIYDDGEYGSPPNFELVRRVSKAKSQGFSKTLKLYYNKEQIVATDLLKLASFSLVQIFVGISLEWRIYHRYTLLCDKRYIVKCHTLDTLVQIKKTFLQVFQAVETAIGSQNGHCVSEDTIWFTQHKKLITESVLRESFDTFITQPGINIEELLHYNRHRSMPLKLSEDRAGDRSVFLDDVFVHFQPKDAVPVHVLYKNEDVTNSVNFSTMLVLPSQIHCTELRQEVSKVVRQQANSIGIAGHKRKMRGTVDLTPGFKIFVTSKKMIMLTVCIKKVPDADEKPDVFTCSFYSYDTVKYLKCQVFRRAGVDHLYQVDMTFGRRLLDENRTFSDNRIKDKDNLEARVYINRLKVLVRMPNRCSHDLLVDDSMSLTVDRIKAFARTVDEAEPFHDCEVTAIVNDRVVSDTDILGLVLSVSRGLPKVLLVRNTNLCFTAATSYNGTLAVLQSSADGNSFQYILAMSDGKRLFCGNIISQENKEFADMLQNRRHAECPPAAVPGIQFMPNFDDITEEREKQHGSFTSEFFSPTHLVCSLSSFRSRDSLKHRSYPQVGRNIQESKAAPKSCLVKRDSCIFHTGNSTSSLVDLWEDSSQTQGGGTSSACFEEDNYSPFALSERDTNVQTAEKRQRNKSEIFRVLQKTAGEPSENLRSKSCPPDPTALSELDDDQMATVRRSGSDLLQYRHTKFSDAKFREDPDGLISFQKDSSEKIRMTPEHARQFFDSNRFAFTKPAVAGGGGGHLTQPDPAYLYVKEQVIVYIAQQLGEGGNQTIRALNLSQSEIDNANIKHPKDLVEKYICLLRCWLTKEGSRATLGRLKEALKSAHRNDLAEHIDRLEPSLKDNVPEHPNLQQPPNPT